MPYFFFVIASSGFGGNAPKGGVVGRLQKTGLGWRRRRRRMARTTCTGVDTREFYRPPEESPGSGDIEHWFSNAVSYFLIGDGMGKAMTQMLGRGKQIA